MHINKPIAQLEDKEFNEFVKFRREKAACAEVLEVAINKCKNDQIRIIAKYDEWWKKMSKKYGFKISSNINISPDTKTINEVVEDPAIIEAERLANTDPDTLSN